MGGIDAMKRTLILVALLTIAGCSSTPTQPQEIEAVRDFVAATELEEVSEIRLRNTLSYTYVNDRYVTVSTRRGDYLVELRRDCFELRRNDFTPEMVDVRDNQNVLRSRFDTIRGCYIGAIYEITEAQREELRNLGDAPGDETYLPDEE
jgi:hypothetical protein